LRVAVTVTISAWRFILALGIASNDASMALRSAVLTAVGSDCMVRCSPVCAP